MWKFILLNEEWSHESRCFPVLAGGNVSLRISETRESLLSLEEIIELEPIDHDIRWVRLVFNWENLTGRVNPEFSDGITVFVFANFIFNGAILWEPQRQTIRLHWLQKELLTLLFGVFGFDDQTIARIVDNTEENFVWWVTLKLCPGCQTSLEVFVVAFWTTIVAESVTPTVGPLVFPVLLIEMFAMLLPFATDTLVDPSVTHPSVRNFPSAWKTAIVRIHFVYNYILYIFFCCYEKK
jgi:hypothetical protein